MRVRDVMTTEVFTIRADKKVFVAKQVMDWAHIRHVPVVDAKHRIVGIISHRDVLEASISALATRITEVERLQHLTELPVLTIMHQSTQTIGPDASVQEAAGMMRRYKVGCLPVVEGDRLVGIVSEHDMLGIVERLPTPAVQSRGPSAT